MKGNNVANDSIFNSEVFLLITLLLVIAIIVYVYKVNKSRRNPLIANNKLTEIDKENVKIEIDNYFKKVEKKHYNSFKFNDLKFQFKIDQIDQSYRLNFERVDDIDQLGFADEESKIIGEQVINKLAIELSSIDHNSNELSYYDSLSFLIDYYILSGEEKAFTEIENLYKISEIDSEQFEYLKQRFKSIKEKNKDYLLKNIEKSKELLS